VATHENQGGIEVLVILLDIVRIVLHRFPLVHRIEVEAGVVSFDGLEERSESILEAESAQRSAMQAMQSESNVPLGVDLEWRGLLFGFFTLFGVLHESPYVLGCSRRIGRTVLVK